MARVQGTTDPKFASVREQLEKNLDVGDDIGASVAVFQHGEPVVDIWGGYQDAEKTVEWQHDTLVNVWSITKTMTFLVALMLAERGDHGRHDGRRAGRDRRVPQCIEPRNDCHRRNDDAKADIDAFGHVSMSQRLIENRPGEFHTAQRIRRERKVLD